MSIRARTHDFDGIWVDPLPPPRVIRGGAQAFPCLRRSYTDQLEEELIQSRGQVQKLEAQVLNLEAHVQSLQAQFASGQAALSKPPTPRAWKPSAARRRGAIKFPLAVEDRNGLAAVIRLPLVLRSGAVLDPSTVAVRLSGKAAVFPDSSWLVLSVLARQPGEFIGRRALGTEVFGGDEGYSVRSAIHRARLTLESVGAASDIESGLVNGSGRWRLLLAGTPS